MYILLDANVTAGYYLPQSLRSNRARRQIEILFDSVRSGKSDHFFYLPNFCVAEVFSVFMKYAFGAWNKHVKKTIDKRVYDSLVAQFERDIHNGAFIYHYELSRYHVLGINLVAPIDHYYRFRRGNKRNVAPMGTFDHLIISMGIHLAHIHGSSNVAIVSGDDRLTDILKKCTKDISPSTRRRLKLDKAAKLTGRPFRPETFPRFVNLKTAGKKELAALFEKWPLEVGSIPSSARQYRYTKL
jgi:hypothetical protein